MTNDKTATATMETPSLPFDVSKLTPAQVAEFMRQLNETQEVAAEQAKKEKNAANKARNDETYKALMAERDTIRVEIEQKNARLKEIAAWCNAHGGAAAGYTFREKRNPATGEEVKDKAPGEGAKRRGRPRKEEKSNE